MMQNVREKVPLIHNITNYVTVNDCANILLACGGSPIMADDPAEVEEITSLCQGLTINMGTLNSTKVTSMLLAGKKANELGHPIVLDPVGAGASAFRTESALKLLNEVRFSVIRGNISEIKTLAFGTGSTKGVDADGKWEKIGPGTCPQSAQKARVRQGQRLREAGAVRGCGYRVARSVAADGDPKKREGLRRDQAHGPQQGARTAGGHGGSGRRAGGALP